MSTGKSHARDPLDPFASLCAMEWQDRRGSNRPARCGAERRIAEERSKLMAALFWLCFSLATGHLCVGGIGRFADARVYVKFVGGDVVCCLFIRWSSHGRGWGGQRSARAEVQRQAQITHSKVVRNSWNVLRVGRGTGPSSQVDLSVSLCFNAGLLGFEYAPVR